jgi:hypothetical protein
MSLKIQSLVVLVQVLNRAIRELDAECEATDGPDKPDLQELLLDYTLVADDLKDEYLATHEPDSNMPSYEELTTRQA